MVKNRDFDKKETELDIKLQRECQGNDKWKDKHWETKMG